jgi:hypothetical protein
MSEDRVVNLILNARNLAKNTLTRFARDLATVGAASRAMERDNDKSARGMDNMERSATKAQQSLARLSGSLRGLLIVGIFAYLQALNTALVGLAGSAFALAGSLTMAAGALGGGMVAAIAQAIPMFGLLIAAFSRVGKVMEAVKYADSAQKAQMKSGTSDTKAASAAADQLASAQQAVADAHRAVDDAQKNLTETRKDARRELQDTIRAEKEAALAMQGAVLSQQEARMALQEAISSGDVGAIAGRQLEVAQSDFDTQEARINLGRARQDSNEVQESGLRGMPQMVAARRQLADATRQLSEAQKNLNQAQRAGASSAGSLSAAQANLQFAMKDLSKAEKELMRTITGFQDRVGKAFRPITDVIIGSFSRAIKRVQGLLLDPSILSGFTKLGDEMSKSIDRITRASTNRQSRAFWVDTLKEARANMRPITSSIINIQTALQRIAVAAGPALRILFRALARNTQQWADSTKNNGLEDFFLRGIKHLRAWWRLMGAIYELFRALGREGQGSAMKTLKDFTGEIRNATKWVEDNRKKVKEFFDGSADSTAAIGRILRELGKQMLLAFNPATIEAVADTLVYIVLPALGDLIRVMGTVTLAFHTILNLPIIRTFARFAATTLAVAGGLIFLKNGIGLVALAWRAFSALFYTNPIILAIAAIVTAIVMLNDRFHFLEPTLKWLQGAFEDTFHWIKEAVNDATKFIGRTFRTLMRNPVFRMLMDTITRPFRLGIRVIKGAFEGIKEIAMGFVDFFKAVFRGDIRGALNAVWRIFKGWTKPFTSLFTGLIDEIKGIWDGLTDILAEPFKFAVGLIEDYLRLLAKGINVILRVLDLGEITIPDLDGSESKSKKGATGGRVRELAGGGFALPMTGVGIGMGTSDLVADALGKLPDGGNTGAKVFSSFGAILSKAVEWIKDKGSGIGGGILDAISFGRPSGGNFVLDVLGGLFGAGGGYVPGPASMKGKDVVPAMLSPEEFVVTDHGEKILERMTGVPGVLNWLAGVQARHGSRAMAAGGRVGFAAGGRAAGERGSVTLTGLDEMADYRSGVLKEFTIMRNQIISLWRSLWRRIGSIGEDGIDGVISDFRMLNKKSSNEMGDLTKALIKNFRQILSVGKNNTKELKTAVYDGLSYLVRETNKSLSAYGANKVNVEISKPGGGKGAATGWIGNPGERGEDEVNLVVGRGEVVLDHGKQAFVNSALNSHYGFGLQDLFKRTKSWHRGGPHNNPYLASGGYSGAKLPGGVSVAIPGFPGEFINSSVLDQALYYARKYKMFITDAFATAGHSGPGHLVSGTAVDYIPGAGGSWDMVERGIAEAVGRGLTVLYDGAAGSTAYPNHGRNHHAHFELSPGAGTGGMGLTQLKRPMVEGTDGTIKALAQLAIDKVRKAANKKLTEELAATMNNTTETQGYDGSISRIFAQVVKDLNAPAKAALALYEAGIVETGDPNLQTNPNYGDSTSRGVLQLLSSTAAAYGYDPMNVEQVARGFLTHGYYGRGGAIQLARTTSLSPGMIAQSVQGSAYPERYDQREEEAIRMMRVSGLSRRVSALREMGYDTGGLLQGPDGMPMPIIAHAGEMILNKSQQALLGGTEYLKRMLGFKADGRFSFQDGGIVGSFADFLGNMANPFENIGNLRPTRGDRNARKEARQIEAKIRRLRKKLEDADKDEKKEIQKDIDKLEKEANKARGKITSRLDKLVKFFSDNGGFSKAIAAMETLFEKIELAVNRAKVTVDKNGRIIDNRLKPGQVLELELGQLQKQLELLLGQDGVLDSKLKEARKLLAKEDRQIENDDNKIRKERNKVGNIREKLRRKGLSDEDRKELKEDLKEAQERMKRLKGDKAKNIKERQKLQGVINSIQASALENAAEIVQTAEDIIAKQAEIFQQRVEDINSSQDLKKTVLDAGNSFIESLASITGQDNPELRKTLAAQQGDAIAQQGKGLRGLLAELIGLDPASAGQLMGAGGLDLFNIIQGLTTGDRLEQIMASLNEDQRAIFTDLVGAVLDNEGALMENTQAIKELEGSINEPLSVNSSAWELFRSAVFNGMGGIMSEFTNSIPQMATGGFAARDGLYYLHAGEKVVPNGGVAGDTAFNLYITEPTEVADPEMIAAKLMWEYEQKSVNR